MQEPALLQVKDLRIQLDTPEGTVHAVNGVSYDLHAGRTLGIVGESGSGKSVHVLSMLGLIPSPPARRVSGDVIYDGRSLWSLGEREMRDVRGKEIGFIFQEPMTALNPVLTVARQIGEPLRRHLKLSRKQALERTVELLDLVGIREPHLRVRQYPHQLSGGMRQRVMIAMAISCNPRLLIADEPTTALDVTIQAQILDLVRDLVARLNMSMIWITHDMGVVAALADEVAVMYGGCVVESGPVRAIFHDPRNAYTRGLLDSLPHADAAPGTRFRQIPGSPPDMTQPPRGDPFAPRNAYATSRCFSEMPPLAQVPDGAPGHKAAVWYDLRTAIPAAQPQDARRRQEAAR